MIICKLDGGENLHEGDHLWSGLGEQESMGRGGGKWEAHSRLREQVQQHKEMKMLGLFGECQNDGVERQRL